MFFLVILLVFIVSFGIAFQAMVEPNADQSFDLIWKILYRPYWQTFGDLFLDDITEGMGKNETPEVILYMRPINERRRYIVTSSLIGWVHTQNWARLIYITTVSFITPLHHIPYVLTMVNVLRGSVFELKKTPYILPSWASYRVSFSYTSAGKLAVL